MAAASDPQRRLVAVLEQREQRLARRLPPRSVPHRPGRRIPAGPRMAEVVEVGCPAQGVDERRVARRTRPAPRAAASSAGGSWLRLDGPESDRRLARLRVVEWSVDRLASLPEEVAVDGTAQR